MRSILDSLSYNKQIPSSDVKNTSLEYLFQK